MSYGKFDNDAQLERVEQKLLELDRLSIDKGRCVVCLMTGGSVDSPAQLVVTVFVPYCEHRVANEKRQAAMCTEHYRGLADDVAAGTYVCPVCHIAPTLAEPIELSKMAGRD